MCFFGIPLASCFLAFAFPIGFDLELKVFLDAERPALPLGFFSLDGEILAVTRTLPALPELAFCKDLWLDKVTMQATGFSFHYRPLQIETDPGID